MREPKSTIGILYNPLSERSMELAVEVAAWLQEQGRIIWRGSSEDARDHPAVLADMELLIALGGDGTALRAARLSLPFRIPVLTIAVGHLNFLSEMSPTELPTGLAILLNGGGWYDQRTLLDIQLQRQGEIIEEFTALNEVALSRGDISRTVTVDVLIDAIPLTTYRSDGVLVATATGSTAYALSAGGPIVDPRSRALVLVPIAAHLTALPSMVLHEDSVITLVTRSFHHAMLAVDGREHVPLEEGDIVQVQRSERVCTFVRVQPPAQFYARLVERLRRE